MNQTPTINTETITFFQNHNPENAIQANFGRATEILGDGATYRVLSKNNLVEEPPFQDYSQTTGIIRTALAARLHGLGIPLPSLLEKYYDNPGD